MGVHPIEIRLEQNANNATLRLNQGNWVLGENLGTHAEVRDGQTYVEIQYDAEELRIRIYPTSEPEQAVVHMHVKTDIEYFDGELSRDPMVPQGTVAVYSKDGDETDYLLPGAITRRVTLPFKPSHEHPCE